MYGNYELFQCSLKWSAYVQNYVSTKYCVYKYFKHITNVSRLKYSFQHQPSRLLTRLGKTHSDEGRLGKPIVEHSTFYWGLKFVTVRR